MKWPLRVVHVVPALFGANGEIGGAERYALELARHMAREVPTRLVSFGKIERRERQGDLEIHVLGGAWYVRGQRFNPLAPGLFAEVARADVVHCHQQHVLASSLSALASRLLRHRVFTTDLGGGGWDFSSYILTDRWFHGHLHISEYSRKVFGHTHDAWARVILGGVDTEIFSPEPSVPKKNAILFVGRVLPHKGVDDLVTAVSPDMELNIVGPTLDKRFQADLEKLAQGKRVAFQLPLLDRALVRAYCEATCVVLPSVYRTRYGDESNVPELLGQTLLEGMACGIPAVCTQVASMPEVVDDGITGFVVPPNDPATLGQRLRWLLDHPAEARRMGDAGRARVLERFTWPQVVRRCLDAYRGAEPT